MPAPVTLRRQKPDITYPLFPPSRFARVNIEAVRAGKHKKCGIKVKVMEKENGKKQIPLRLSAKLYAEIAAWAEDDFRSVNGQIEYLLTECVKKRKGKSGQDDKGEKN